jgi:hypothetical protein
MKQNMNLPLSFQNKNILIAGAGGGFDAYAGLPLYHVLKENNQVFFANFSTQADSVVRLAEFEYPEGQMGVPCYLLPRAGVQLVRAAYKLLIARHNIDVIILVDGGVDSLMIGDEIDRGTVLEDFISLAAVGGTNDAHPIGVHSEWEKNKDADSAEDNRPLPQLILACVGLGTEQEENLDHSAMMENIAALMKAGAFLGCSALTKSSPAFEFYKNVCESAWKHGRKSHIHSRIIPAVEGEYGSIETPGVDARLPSVYPESGPQSIIHPLMGIYWFFDLLPVVQRNKCIKLLEKTNTFVDARIMLKQLEPDRQGKKVPLF